MVHSSPSPQKLDVQKRTLIIEQTFVNGKLEYFLLAATHTQRFSRLFKLLVDENL